MTIVMSSIVGSCTSSNTVSRAAFNARALEILRRVQATGGPLIITDRGRPVLRPEPDLGEDDAVLASLRGQRGRLVLRYPVREWIARAEVLAGLWFLPVDTGIAIRAVELPDLHPEPATA